MGTNSEPVLLWANDVLSDLGEKSTLYTTHFPMSCQFWGGRWNLYWLGSIIPLSSYNILSSRNVVKTNNNIVLCFHYLDIQWWCCAVIYHYNERVTVALTIFTDICVNNVIKNVYDELYPVKLLPVLILHSLNYTVVVSLIISPSCSFPLAYNDRNWKTIKMKVHFTVYWSKASNLKWIKT